MNYKLRENETINYYIIFFLIRDIFFKKVFAKGDMVVELLDLYFSKGNIYLR